MVPHQDMLSLEEWKSAERGVVQLDEANLHPELASFTDEAGAAVLAGQRLKLLEVCDKDSDVVYLARQLCKRDSQLFLNICPSALVEAAQGVRRCEVEGKSEGKSESKSESKKSDGDGEGKNDGDGERSDGDKNTAGSGLETKAGIDVVEGSRPFTGINAGGVRQATESVHVEVCPENNSERKGHVDPDTSPPSNGIGGDPGGNLARFLGDYEARVMYFQNEILTETDLVRRAKVLEIVVFLAAIALKERNFHLLVACAEALSSPCIARLGRTWRIVEQGRIAEHLNRLDLHLLALPQGNYLLARQQMKRLVPDSASPRVPFLPPLLALLRQIGQHPNLQRPLDIGIAAAAAPGAALPPQLCVDKLDRTFRVLKPFVVLSRREMRYPWEAQGSFQRQLDGLHLTMITDERVLAQQSWLLENNLIDAPSRLLTFETER